MYSVKVPISVMLTKRKRYPLNLNHYRNAHFRENHKGKELFQSHVKPKILALPKFSQVLLFYKVFPARKSDVANICSIVDKFFCDALVETGRLEDDNMQVVKGVTYLSGEVDPHEPRVEIGILPLKIHQQSETDPMKIIIHQAEIEQAITDYINSQVNVRPGQKIAIDLAATRGSAGFTAEISISRPEEVAIPTIQGGPTELEVPTLPVETLEALQETPVEVGTVEEAVTELNTPEEEEVVAEEEVTEAPRKSLFAGLARK